MRALLLAGGFGTRLRPLTETIPKCLVSVRGKPLLSYWFDLLFSSGFDRVLVNTHYLPEIVSLFISQSPWSRQIDQIHEETILGTGGTVLANFSWFNHQPFLVAHADNLTIFEVSHFLDRHAHRPPECCITMMTFDTDAPHTCGIVEEKDGVVIAFHEKVQNPPGFRANAAVYMFQPEVVAYMSTLNKAVIDISTEVLPYFLGRIFTFHNDQYHRDIGNLESLALAELEFAHFKNLF